jgi:hypothetical protein
MRDLATQDKGKRGRSPLRSLAFGWALSVGATLALPSPSYADEDGVSFWLPGLFGSLAAVPQKPGWQATATNYFDSVSASGGAAVAREITIGKLNPTININANVNVKATIDLTLINAGYVFEKPVLGGQLNVGLFGLVGPVSTQLNGALTLSAGPLTAMRQGTISQTTTGFGDLYPLVIMRWNNGVHNWMVYGTGDIPVGDHSATNLANIGIGHGAADGGGGYTYFDPKLGHEFSAVTGFTYNLINPSTGYQNGIDWHLDWGASQFLTQHFFVGAVGYFYEQISPDSGCAPQFCPFESGVIGVGPQVGFILPLGGVQAYLNLKAYGEFAGHDRPTGFNTWLTLSFSPLGPANPRSAMLTK